MITDLRTCFSLCSTDKTPQIMIKLRVKVKKTQFQD
jgi:hypothetical protein